MMAKDSQKNISLIVMLLIIVIILLVVGLGFLFLKYENLEEKYDDMFEDRYDVDYGVNNGSDKNPSTNTEDTNSNSSSKYIAKDEVLQIVLKDMNVKHSDIYDLDIELEYKPRYGETVYEVSFDYKQFEYEYYLDAETGKILDSFKTWD